MFFFNKKSPEEKAAEHLEMLRRTEGDRAFGGALITPTGDLALADICIVQLDPQARCLRVSCHKKEFLIPYGALTGMTSAS